VKAIALHGLGLNVYAGEDLPTHIEVAGEPLTKPARVEPIRPPSGDAVTEKQLSYIQHLLQATDSDVESLLSYFGFESLETIPRADASRVIKALQSRKRAA